MNTSIRRSWQALACCMLLGWATQAVQAQSTFPQKHVETEHEEHSGRWVLGGSLSAWMQSQGSDSHITLAPEVGYLFNDTFGLGLVGGYHYLREDGETSHAWSLRPFARYYYLHREPFNLYVDGGLGISGGGGRNGWEVGLRPGACVDLTKGICLCLRMGFLGYRSRFTGGEEAELTPSGWGFRFAPEELQIGLELEL